MKQLGEQVTPSETVIRPRFNSNTKKDRGGLTALCLQARQNDTQALRTLITLARPLAWRLYQVDPVFEEAGVRVDDILPAAVWTALYTWQPDQDFCPHLRDQLILELGWDANAFIPLCEVENFSPEYAVC